MLFSFSCLFFLLGIQAVLCVYEDQHQEFDWQMSNIGPHPTTLIFQTKYAVVSTAEGVLAAINLRSGKTTWRNILDKNTQIVEAVSGEDVVYTLSVRKNYVYNVASSIVQAWSSSSGDLLWDAAIADRIISIDDDVHLPSGAKPSLILDEDKKQLRVLDNTQVLDSSFSILDSSTGNVLSHLNASDMFKMLPHQSSSEVVGIIPLHLVQVLSSSHVLSGCIYLSPAAECASTFVLDLKPKPDIHIFPGFTDVNGYDKIISLITSKTTGFNTNDVIVHIKPSSPTEISRSAVFFKSQRISSGSMLPALADHGSDFNVAPFLLNSTAGINIAFSICSGDKMSCTSHMFIHKDDESFQTGVIVSCDGSQSSVFSVDRSSKSSSLASAVVCTSLSSDDTDSDSISMTLTSKYATGLSNSPIIVEFQYPVALAVDSSANSSSMTRLGFVSAQRYTALQSREDRLKVLTVSSTGAMHMFQKRDKEQKQIQWTRDESLARVVDAVILDGVAFHSNEQSRVDSTEGLLPSLSARLDMQMADIREQFQTWIAQFTLGEWSTNKRRSRPSLETFGFNKVAVMLTSMCPVETSSFTGEPVVPQKVECLHGLKVIGMDVISGDILWNFEPVVPPELLPADRSSFVRVFARLLSERPHVKGSLEPATTLLVSLESLVDGSTALLSFSFNPLSGQQTDRQEACKQSSAPHRPPSSVTTGQGHVTSVQLYNGDSGSVVQQNSFLVVHRSRATSPLVSLFPPTSTIANTDHKDVYIQVCSEDSCSSLSSYRVQLKECISAQQGLYRTELIGSVVFHQQGEAVVAVQHPTVGDPVHSRAKVLGDNSLLIKYLNPHMAVVVTQKMHSPSDEKPTEAEDGSDPEVLLEELFVNVVDTVSSQVVHRHSILHASTALSGRDSVQVAIIENNVFVSYWSTQAQRQELSSVSLFEGMIDKYALGPFSSMRVDQVRSSFNSPPPISLQKTFVLPRKVTSMHHTVTSRGITNKHLLLGLGSGQLYALDIRMLDPRRPSGKPSPAEIEEKLIPYVPFLPLHPYQTLSTNSTLPSVRQIMSSPSKLESTSIVMSFGLDVFHTRTIPSKGFDLLASDFNKLSLSLILLAMGVAVMWLRRAYKKRLVNSGWK